MLDKRFNIDESPNIVVNLTFSTTVLADGSGGEERNSNWQSPLLNFDLQKVILHKPQLDEIIQFLQATRGAALSFRYRDWSDYLVTAQARDTRYGSTTEGLLLPNADGVRTEFELVKRYTVPSCTHYRAIALPDPETVTLYNANFNPFADTDWIFADGKFIFTNPPPAGQLFCEGEFDLPVVFASDENQYRIKSAKGGNTYSIEGLQLNEVRIQNSEFRNEDELAEIDIAFALSGHFNSLVGLREQTQIITLASGFDKRTSRFPKPKGTYFLGKIPLHDEELEYLIAFFRCTKGKGLSWGFEDVSYQQKLVAVRFDEDNLSLRLNHRGRYETDGLKVIEVFEPLPAALIDPFAISTQEYLKFFSAPQSGSNPALPTPVINGYPAPPFYLLDLPYLSVFINSDTPKKLVSTYNGVQRIIGDISYFNGLNAVNLNYKGNGKFYGTALSADKTKFITFTDSGIGTVKNIQNPNSIYSGNIAYDSSFISVNSYTFPLTPQVLPAPFISLPNRIVNDPVGWQNISLDPNSSIKPRITYSPNSHSYTDIRNTVGVNPGGYSKHKVAWDYQVGGGSVEVHNLNVNRPSISYSNSGNISLHTVDELEHIWDGTLITQSVGTDGDVRIGKTISRGRNLSKNIVDHNVTGSVTGYTRSGFNNGGTYTLIASGDVSSSSISEVESIQDTSGAVVVSDHHTIERREYSKTVQSSLGKKDGAINNQQVGDYNNNFSKYDAETIYESTNYSSIFNVGDLGIFLELKDFSKSVHDNSFKTLNSKFRVNLASVFNPLPPSQPYYDRYHTVGVSDYGTGNSTVVNNIFTTSIVENSRLYKIAYLNHIRNAKPGYAAICSFTQANTQAIHNFHLNSIPGSLTIDLSSPYRQWLKDFGKRINTQTNSGAIGETTAGNINYELQDIDVNDRENVDLNNQLIVVKQAYSGNIYLALCRVNSLVSTTVTNTTDTTQVIGMFRTVTKLNCEIINVQKIKSFFTTSSFLFTVNGCEVFRFLDPYRTNLIKDKGKVYLAATMPAVSEYNTQTLVFQLVSDGLEFYGVFGGRVDSIGSSLGADKWIKYY